MSIDKKEYKKGNNNPKIYYGLPREIKFCSKCTYNNQKPNSEIEFKHNINTKKPILSFDENDICDACKLNDKKKKIDWKTREKELKILCNKFRSKDGSYDCVVPGSGGKDSFFTAHILKYKYKMNPLTVTWAPHIYTDWGWKNLQSWIGTGFDNYLFTPATTTHRLLTRLALENLFHPFQPFMVGQMLFPPKIANKLNIKLIFYGENPEDYGNKKTTKDSPIKDLKFFSKRDDDNFLISGLSENQLKKYGISANDLIPYKPIEKSQFLKNKIQVHYLGYYLKWHPQENYYYTIENSKFTPSPERTPGTYSKYSSIDDKMDDLHYYTTYIKFGIGRATYDSSQEIRNGEIERKEGIDLVKKFDGEYPLRFERELFEYLSINKKEFPQAYKKFDIPEIDREYFFKIADKFRSPHLWYYSDEKQKWYLRKSIFNQES
tara:strand:+ start:22547 stop:23848 length:1302 start_codon:yes stop_codon:yes gene_type:complete